MPIFIKKNKIVHFAHIPKTGGTTIEQYIISSGQAKYAFMDMQHVANPSRFSWNNSSPQHVDGNTLRRLFPVNFFTHFFTFVRDPVDRFISAYLFQLKEPFSAIKNDDINEFIENELVNGININGWCDNHFLPQHMFLYPGGNYSAFLLGVEGMIEAKRYIDKLFEIRSKTTELPYFQKGDRHETETFRRSLSSVSLSRLKEIYKRDYELLKSFKDYK